MKNSIRERKNINSQAIPLLFTFRNRLILSQVTTIIPNLKPFGQQREQLRRWEKCLKQ